MAKNTVFFFLIQPHFSPYVTPAANGENVGLTNKNQIFFNSFCIWYSFNISN